MFRQNLDDPNFCKFTLFHSLPNLKTIILNDPVFGEDYTALYYTNDIHQGLKTNESERRLSQQALKILLEKLDDLFLYIEPTESSMSTYSHKTRELLILACTEVENFWMHYMQISNNPS
ncbi:hypothetical protein EG349_19960 (plasmid) [Chryseobacterium shandongense]|uniref:Uncharacterized protein n=1 Tax=Chryseobacterium shandongense TaxID=1493872 RepID=A0AAD1DNR4_9FLAO|nr:hypothetical protein EG349_19960 [Chryseobacterium shandongense]